MTDAKKDKEPTIDEAKEIVRKDADASKDGITTEQTDAGSGIVMKPDPTDRSVRTYDPKDVRRDPQVSAKPSKNSGRPVHDRS